MRAVTSFAFATLMLIATTLALRAEPADPAIAQVEKFHAALLDVMKKGADLGVDGRYKKLEAPVDAAFDLPSMTKFAVGPAWSKMTDAEHASLTVAFRRMTVASYAHNFASFDGQKFVVEPVAEVRKTERLVKSQVIPADQKPVNLTYRMREAAGTWKVIDVIYEYVSQVATRRSDFASTVSGGGAAALVKKLDEISDGLMKGK